ncbi:murein biosynthesis integral membrane protein MurJ [Thermophilibacter sp.]
MTQRGRKWRGAHFAQNVGTAPGVPPAPPRSGELAADPAPDDASGSVKERANQSSNMVSVLVIISRVTGFFRTSMQAWALGAGGLASAYTIANQLPNMLYELVVGGMLITSFLPVYLSTKRKLGREGASGYASNLLSVVLMLMTAVTVLSFVFAGPVIWTQSAGATEGFDSALAIWFFRWFSCSIILYALSSIVSGVLNAERDYFWSNLAPIFNNVITIGSFVAYGALTRAGVPQDSAILVLAIGTPLGVAVQVLSQLPALYRHGVRLRLRVDLRDPALRETLSIGLPTLVATLSSYPTTAVASSCALSVTAAGASIAYYARVWYVLPYSIFAIPISVTMFTELSSSWLAKDLAAYRDYLADGMRKIFFTLIPCSMYLIVFAPALVAVFSSGQFTAEAAEQTVGYLRALALALPFYALSTYLQKVCSSMMHMGLFAFATVVASAIQIAFCVALTPVWGLYVVPVSSVFFYGVVDLVTLLRVRSRAGRVGARSVLVSCARALALGALGSAVGALVLWALTRALGPCEGIVRGVLYAVAGGVPAVVVTFGTATALGVCDAPFFESLFSKALRLLHLR